jgi:NAD(P)-dependent dehydrogenase (short-subunit alcohol dehydrogenase family)
MKKTVLVTGATGTIGKATSLELAKNACQLILFGRNIEKLNAAKSEIAIATGNRDIEIIVADLSESKSIRQATAEIREKYSSLNALVNIAAIFKSTRLENSEGLEYMFATNHLGPFMLTNELLDLLKSGKPSRIVTVSAPSTTKINFDDMQRRK